MVDHRLAVVVAGEVPTPAILTWVGEVDGIGDACCWLVAIDLHAGPLAAVVAKIAKVQIADGVAGDVFVVDRPASEGVLAGDRAMLVGGVDLWPIAAIVVPGKIFTSDAEAGGLRQG